MINLRAVKRIDWEYVVSRNEPALFRSFTATAGGQMRRATGLPWQPTLELRPGPELFHSRHELVNLRRIFKRMSIQSFLRFRQRLLQTMQRFQRLTDGIEQMDVRRFSDERLTALFAGYVEGSLNAHAFLMPLPVADRVLASFILDRLPRASGPVRQDWLTTLSFPTKENLHVIEERSFLKLVGLYISRSPRFNAAFRRHRERFGRLGARGMWWRHAWTTTDLRRRVREFVAQGKSWRNELDQLNAVRREQAAAARRLVRKLRLERSWPLIRLVKEFAWLRTYRTDVVYNGHFAVQNFLREIARRCHIRPTDDIVFLTFKEILTSKERARSVVSPVELKCRKNFFATFVHDGEMELVSGQAWKRNIGALSFHQHRPRTAIRGTPAFTGRTRGRVAVVLSAADVGSVKRGDILIAVMTFPHYIAAMEKAAAFVTDEGGILCHAAIIAREMKKPCVIGTKIATQVLKNGDRVEVDATNGIVKRI